MKTEHPYELLFEALVKIKNDFHEKISSLDEDIRCIQLECAENAFQQQKEALDECLDGIDQQLITLSVYIEEYRNLYGSLKKLNEKIPELGGKAQVVPEPIVGDSIVEVVAGRFDYLKSQGKIKDQ
jgi:hypothetical protein